MAKPNNHYFENLDGLRFIAATIVVLMHTGIADQLSNIIESTFILKLLSVLSMGGKAVSFFFVLSGFLISYLILKEIENTGKINFKNFFARRILRIWPLYFFVILLGLYVLPYIKVFLLKENYFIPNYDLAYFLFLSNFDILRLIKLGLDGSSPLILHLTWSLSIEEQFYLIWPIGFLLFRKKVWLFFLLTIISSIIFRYYFFNGENGINTLNCIGDFGVGSLLAYAIQEKKNVIFLEKLKKGWILLTYLCDILYMINFNFLSEAFGLEVFSRLILTSFFGFIIAEQSFCKNSFFKLSNSTFLSKSGKLTYGIYLLHPLALLLSSKILSSIELNLYLLYLLLSLILTYLLAFFSFYYFEVRFIKMKKLFRTTNEKL